VADVSGGVGLANFIEQEVYRFLLSKYASDFHHGLYDGL